MNVTAKSGGSTQVMSTFEIGHDPEPVPVLISYSHVRKFYFYSGINLQVDFLLKV
jgi:hypothetical protein